MNEKDRRSTMETRTTASLGKGHAIFTVALSTLIMISSAFSLFKFTPIMTYFLEAYHLDMVAMSNVMSVFNWVLIIIGLPVGIFLSKYPAKYSGAFGALCIVCGNVVSMLSGTMAALIVGRVIEAIGYCTLQVLTNCLVTNLFKDSRLRGTMVGIVGVGLMLGQTVYFNVAPRIAVSSGLQGVYLMIIIVVAILGVLWLIGIRKESRVEALNSSQKMDKAQRRQLRMAAFKSKDLILIAIAYAVLRMGIATAGQYVVAYLETERGVDNISAASLASVATTLGIVMMVFTGVICDLLKTRRKVQIISSFSIILVWILLMKLPVDLLVICFIIYGTVPRTYTTVTYSSYPDIFDDASVIPIAHSTVQFVGNVIGAVATMIFGAVITYAGYSAMWTVCMVLGAIGGVCWIMAKKVK